MPHAHLDRERKPTAAFAHHKLDPFTSEHYDLVKALEAKHDGIIHRQVLETGEVRLAMERTNGDRIAATGPDQVDALEKLHTRLEALPADA